MVYIAWLFTTVAWWNLNFFALTDRFVMLQIYFFFHIKYLNEGESVCLDMANCPLVGSVNLGRRKLGSKFFLKCPG